MSRSPRPLGEVFSIYAETLTPGPRNPNTLTTEPSTRRHFSAGIGEKVVFDSLGRRLASEVRRSRHNEGVGRETIHKELSTLRSSGRGHSSGGTSAAPLAGRWRTSRFPRPREASIPNLGADHPQNRTGRRDGGEAGASCGNASGWTRSGRRVSGLGQREWVTRSSTRCSSSRHTRGLGGVNSSVRSGMIGTSRRDRSPSARRKRTVEDLHSAKRADSP